MLDFPDSPVDGQASAQPNGLTYYWSAAKTRWDATILGAAGSPLCKQTTVEADTVFALDIRCVFLRVWLTGGGGGGGGIACQVGEGAQSRPGSGGATAIWWGVPDGDMTIVIGAGGLKGAAGNNDGLDGEDSTLLSAGSLINLVGGGGLLGRGSAGNNSSSNRIAVAGGVATGGKTNIPGGDADSGAIIITSPVTNASSGGSWWGVGRHMYRNNGCPDNGVAHAGIGGMANSIRREAVNRSGGGGGQGLCVIEEWLSIT